MHRFVVVHCGIIVLASVIVVRFGLRGQSARISFDFHPGENNSNYKNLIGFNLLHCPTTFCYSEGSTSDVMARPGHLWFTIQVFPPIGILWTIRTKLFLHKELTSFYILHPKSNFYCILHPGTTQARLITLAT